MSNAYTGALRDGRGDIIYPATSTRVVYDDDGRNIDDKVKYYIHVNGEREEHTQVDLAINAHTLDGKDLDWILENASGTAAASYITTEKSFTYVKDLYNRGNLMIFRHTIGDDIVDLPFSVCKVEDGQQVKFIFSGTIVSDQIDAVQDTVPVVIASVTEEGWVVDNSGETVQTLMEGRY